MKITIDELNTYGVTATLHNFYFPTNQPGICRVKIVFENGDPEGDWYFADANTFFKPLLGKPLKIIVNPDTKTLVYPNSETHPQFVLPKLPDKFAKVDFRPKKN